MSKILMIFASNDNTTASSTSVCPLDNCAKNKRWHKRQAFLGVSYSDKRVNVQFLQQMRGGTTDPETRIYKQKIQISYISVNLLNLTEDILHVESLFLLKRNGVV